MPLIRPGETPEAADKRLAAEWQSLVVRLDELRNLRKSLGRSADDFIKARHGEQVLAELDRAEAEQTARDQAARNQAEADAAAARAEAQAHAAARLATASVADLSPSERAAWERQHGIVPSNRYR